MATQKQVFTEITESIDRCNHTLPGLIQFLKNGFKKLENASGGGGGGSTVEWTQIQASGTKIAEIEIDGDKTSVYAPTGATPTISVNAEDVAYSNTVSGLTADNCQEAIDELKSLIPASSGSVSVTADGVKTLSTLLDELFALIDSSKITDNAVIVDNNVIYRLYRKDNQYGFSICGVVGAASITTFIIKSSGSTFKIWDNAGGAVIDHSSDVPAVGRTYTIKY